MTGIWVVLPAYNEGGRIGCLLDELKKRSLSILVVDDGSNDNTYMVAKDKADVILKNESNLGKGLSLKRGIMFLLKNKDFSYTITMDADGQHSPVDLDIFLREAKEGVGFVIGNRMYNPSGMPLVRQWTNKIMSWIISKIVKQKIPDTQCGFRLIRKDILNQINIETDKFEVESEILIKAARSNFPIKSIPIESIYFKDNTSRIHPLFDTIRFIRFIMSLEK